MGDSVSSATNAIKEGAKDAASSVRVGYKKVVNKGLREEINRGLAVAMPTAYAGNAVGVATYESGGDLQEGLNQAAGDIGLGQTVMVPDPNAGASAAPTVADPQQKRRRQIAGRAGTLLTGGGTDGGGTNLGGAGGRSTLLGL